jgi:hypothetical protein
MSAVFQLVSLVYNYMKYIVQYNTLIILQNILSLARVQTTGILILICIIIQRAVPTKRQPFAHFSRCGEPTSPAIHRATKRQMRRLVVFRKITKLSEWPCEIISWMRRGWTALQRNSVYIFLFWDLRGLSPNFHIHVSVSDLYIPRIGPHISSSRKDRPIVEIYNSFTDTWMWKLGLSPRYYTSGNICFKFSAFCLCSVGWQ